MDTLSLPAEVDLALLRVTIEISRDAVDHGNHPFGALLADDEGVILLRAENTVLTGQDPTGHAELNLVRWAARELDRPVVAAATLYASCEPCAMCAGAIYWTGIRRVVLALDGAGLGGYVGDDPANPMLALPSRRVFEAGDRATDVVGPLLPDEAGAVHRDFWTRPNGP